MSNFNPHRISAPKTFLEELEDAIERSGSDAKIVRHDGRTRRATLKGDYAALLLAKQAMKKIGVTVEDVL